jgi:DNA recombination protein RmuC
MENVLTIGLALAAVVLALWAVGAWLRARIEAQAAATRQEMLNVVSSQVQALVGPVGQLTQTVTQQLGQITGELRKGVADSGLLASRAQEAVTAELKGSREMLERINQQLGEAHQASLELSQATQTLHAVLGGAKTRGTLGELGLERLLADALPASIFETQYGFSTGTKVDAVIKFGGKLVPIDSKFPLDAYRRLMEADDEEREPARKEFARAVRAHADSIAEKYILPGEGTTDYAFMFIPSEGVYYELLLTEDARGGSLADYCRSRKVVAISPNVFYAYLQTILMGLRGMRVEENARRLLAGLEGLQKQFEVFAELYEKLGSHLRNAYQNYGEAEAKLDRARDSLGQMVQGALPESSAQAAAAGRPLYEPTSRD